MVVVAGGVLPPGGKQRVVLHNRAHGVQPLGVGSKGALVFIGQTVQAHVLLLARTVGVGKGILLLLGLDGDAAPGRLVETRSAVDGHGALVELLAVAQHVFRHLAQVDVEFAGVAAGSAILAGVDEGVEHPELHILDVGLLEVGGLQAPHHAAPLLGGVHQRAVGVELRGQVVGAALLGVVGQVEHGQRRGDTAVR